MLLPVDAPPLLSPCFETALAFAARLHATQVRKGTAVPYLSHLLGVASLALEYGANEDEATAALLHDAIEDAGGVATEAVIAHCFGANVAEIVRGCTDADTEPKPAWRARKEAYVAHLATASPSIRLVSCCDKIYNARAILRDYKMLGEILWDRFSSKRDGTLWYYGALADAFTQYGPDVPAQELNLTVTELERLTGVARQT